MKIGVPRENDPRETRVPLVPESVKKLVESGAQVEVESGLGATIGVTDGDYADAGAGVASDRAAALSAELVVRLGEPALDDIRQLASGSVHLSYLDPFRKPELMEALAEQGVSAIGMEMIPRTTRAQKMDALSSQANLAGYVAVILAADRLKKILPMMTTPAGTIKPSRAFIIGAGVAGLQAIATAKRLGAIVEAYDTRPVVEEQVRSLGGRFVTLDIGETGETEQGYAKELTPEQIKLQQQAMAKVCSRADIVVTTAQLFGRPAPRIVTAEMLSAMRPGSVVVDLAVDSGGNVEGSKVDEAVNLGGVEIIGLSNFPGEVAVDASQMYSSNVTNLITEFWDEEGGAFNLDLEDEIIQGCLVTHAGAIVHDMFKKEPA